MRLEQVEWALLGTVMHSPVRGELEVLDPALVGVAPNGAIVDVITPGYEGFADASRALETTDRLRRLSSSEYLLPGLVDLHNHAPQWPQMGKSLHLPLEEWLLDHTFPLEAKFADIDFALEVYSSLVDATLANGTTTAMYFGTIHLEATKALAETCIERGQRALIGKVAMDNPATSPSYYRDRDVATSLDETEALVAYISDHPDNESARVLPAVTPRFLPSCTDELLEGLGAIAANSGCHVQTHCSESDWARSYGLERFDSTDTAVYDDFGLLTGRTVLAHANFVTPEDLARIRRKGAAIAHCPVSNFYFANAAFPAREVLDQGVKCGLGTDVSGGPSPSMFNAAANAVIASRAREDGVDASLPAARRGVADARITFLEGFWLATTGGGIALDLPIGLLAPGYWFDAIIVDSSVSDTNLVVWPEMDTPADVLQKMIHNAGRLDITEVWVAGRQQSRAVGAVASPGVP